MSRGHWRVTAGGVSIMFRERLTYRICGIIDWIGKKSNEGVKKIYSTRATGLRNHRSLFHLCDIREV